MAGVLALGAAWLGARYLAVRGELALLRDQNALLEIALESAQQQLEAERIITRRLLLDASTPISSKNGNATHTGESQSAPR